MGLVEELTLGVIVAAAAADSINPCVFGVLIFLLAYMTRVFKNDKKRMLVAGLVYVAAVYITYFLLGLGIFTVAYTAQLSVPFYYLAIFVAFAAGLLELKDFFWYGKGFTLQMLPGGAERFKRYVSYFEKVEKRHPLLSIALAFGLGVFVPFVELPCTGAPYLVILGMIAKGLVADAIPLLLLYNLIFILPLFVIIGLVYFGTTAEIFESWRKRHRAKMRLFTGLILIALGAYMWWSIL